MYDHEYTSKSLNETPTQREIKRQQTAAQALGRECVYPAANELFLDLDSLEQLGRFHANREHFAGLIADVHARRSPSGTTGRYHVVVQLTRFVRDQFERIALQALLGSDLTREAVAWRRATDGAESVTVFFEKPGYVQPPALAVRDTDPAPALSAGRFSGIAPAAPNQCADIDRPPSTVDSLRNQGPETGNRY